ncbi:MAG: cytochrome c3 family protein [Anaerolineae bacterium]|nr:cytochrome c3 family protein [Anaerolineae bacterium]
MPKQQPKPRRIRRFFKRLVRLAGFTLVTAIVLGAVGTAGVWSHFWGTRIGNPTADSCANCHPMQPYVESERASTLLASAHAGQGVTCLDCHDYGAEQQLRDTLAFLRGQYDDPLPRQRYGMDVCLSCHEHGSYEQIAWRTTDLGVTDSQAKGHEANPHQPPHYDELECNSCHRIHQPGTLLCWECHTYKFDTPYIGERAEATPQPAPP